MSPTLLDVPTNASMKSADANTFRYTSKTKDVDALSMLNTPTCSTPSGISCVLMTLTALAEVSLMSLPAGPGLVALSDTNSAAAPEETVSLITIGRLDVVTVVSAQHHCRQHV